MDPAARASAADEESADVARRGTRRSPLLVYLYGPPAVGKLTIAEELQRLTSFRLFHNHLTVNAVRQVFEFGSPAFAGLLRRIRLDVFATAMRAGTSVIFTNNSAWGGEDGNARFRNFALEAARVVDEAGGTALFTHLTAPLEVLEARLASHSRREHGKLVDVRRLRELVAHLDGSPLDPDHLSVDTSRSSVEQAAQLIAAAATHTGR